jgi:hypothetical protein
MHRKSLHLMAKLSFLMCVLLASGAWATGYTLTVSADGSGSVSNVTVTAVPNYGWYFDHWSGDASGSSNPLNVTMTTNLAIIGHFLPLPVYVVTLQTNGQGTIALNPPGGSYPSNAVVTATATPANGWVFDSWSGDIHTAVNPQPLTVNTNVSLIATFGQLPAFDLQPVSITNAVVGSTVSFAAHAVGSTPLAMQWYFSGGLLPGATTSTLTLTNVSSFQVGNYWLIATNRYGSATSSNVSLTLTNATGATHVVNSQDDASLRAAIALGGWIGFGFSGTVTLTNTIPITTNVFLDGNGVAVTISGGNAVRLFSVAPGVTFSVTNVTLANGTCLVTNNQADITADGGAIYNAGGYVTLVSCIVTNNNALCRAAGGIARGGAIFTSGGTVSLFQTSVSNSLAIGGGLAAPQPNPVYTNRAFGGAIYSANGALTITGCTISSNLCQAFQDDYIYSVTMGGAAFQASGSMLVEDSLFASNQALGGPPGTTMPATPAYGGALAATAGSVTINHSQFLGNSAQGGNAPYHKLAGAAFGGAVYSAAGLAAKDSAFFGNQAFAGSSFGTAGVPAANGYGGAIYSSGTAGLNSCSIYSNLCAGGSSGNDGLVAGVGGEAQGGGIFNAAQLGATNCTLALNSVNGGKGGSIPSRGLGRAGNAFGGGVFNDASATFAAMNLTIASNACTSPSDLNYYYTNGTATGFQIANNAGTLRLHNSLIAYSGTNANAYGTITDDGYNMSSDGSAQFSGGSSYSFTDPKLGPLGDYGGPTLCMALLASSPAIDTGDPAHSPGTDQRGAVRPFGAGPDMGAYEFGAAAPGYTLDVGVDGSGFVTKNPTHSVYPPSATVTVTAAPSDGWYFDHWSGGASGSSNPLSVTMNTNVTITAHFVAFPYTITLQTNGQGTIALNPPGGRYLSNALVTATATPTVGWAFDSWSGATSSTTNPLALTVNSNLSLTGTFKQLSGVCVLPPPGLVGWWRGEGDVTDASGNNNNGTLPAPYGPGIVGQAFSFGGQVTIPDSPSLRLTSQLTIEAWINCRTTNAPYANVIVSKISNAGYNCDGPDPHGYQFMLSGNSLIGSFNSPGQAWPGYRIQCALPVAIGTWCHAAWTYDQSAMKLYWNGQPVATNVIGTHPIATNTYYLEISDYCYTFNGLIDEPSVYNRALSDSEIAAIYYAGSAGKCINQQVLPHLGVATTPSNVVVSFAAWPTNLYCLQAGTNLVNWTDLSTNGPFAYPTNVSQMFSLQGFKSRYFRVRVE